VHTELTKTAEKPGPAAAGRDARPASARPPAPEVKPVAAAPLPALSEVKPEPAPPPPEKKPDASHNGKEQLPAPKAFGVKYILIGLLLVLAILLAIYIFPNGCTKEEEKKPAPASAPAPEKKPAPVSLRTIEQCLQYYDRQDYPMALSCFRERADSAEVHDPRAQYELGRIYRDGVIPPKNISLAKFYFGKSAAQAWQGQNNARHALDMLNGNAPAAPKK